MFSTSVIKPLLIVSSFIYAKMALDYLSSVRTVGEAVQTVERLPPVCDSKVFDLCRTLLENILSKHPENERSEA
jgi:hypothetical protein